MLRTYLVYQKIVGAEAKGIIKLKPNPKGRRYEEAIKYRPIIAESQEEAIEKYADHHETKEKGSAFFFGSGLDAVEGFIDNVSLIAEEHCFTLNELKECFASDFLAYCKQELGVMDSLKGIID